MPSFYVENAIEGAWKWFDRKPVIGARFITIGGIIFALLGWLAMESMIRDGQFLPFEFDRINMVWILPALFLGTIYGVNVAHDRRRLATFFGPRFHPCPKAFYSYRYESSLYDWRMQRVFVKGDHLHLTRHCAGKGAEEKARWETEFDHVLSCKYCARKSFEVMEILPIPFGSLPIADFVQQKTTSK